MSAATEMPRHGPGRGLPRPRPGLRGAAEGSGGPGPGLLGSRRNRNQLRQPGPARVSAAPRGLFVTGGTGGPLPRRREGTGRGCAGGADRPRGLRCQSDRGPRHFSLVTPGSRGRRCGEHLAAGQRPERAGLAQRSLPAPQPRPAVRRHLGTSVPAAAQMWPTELLTGPETWWWESGSQ